MLVALDQGLANFFCVGPDNTYFKIAGHKISLATTQLCFVKPKAARGNMYADDCVPKQLHFRVGGPNLALWL